MQCRKCGRYTDECEWPPRDLANFTGELCYSCFLESRDEKPPEPQDDDDSDDDNLIDKPDDDPELDDAPDVDAFPVDQTDPEQYQLQQPLIPNEEGQANDETFPEHSFTDPNQSVEDTKRMLFG